MTIAQIAAIIQLLIAFSVPQATVSDVQSILQAASPNTGIQVVVPDTLPQTNKQLTTVSLSAPAPTCVISITGTVTAGKADYRTLRYKYQDPCGVTPSSLNVHVFDSKDPSRTIDSGTADKHSCFVGDNQTTVTCDVLFGAGEIPSGLIEIDVNESTTTVPLN